MRLLPELVDTFNAPESGGVLLIALSVALGALVVLGIVMLWMLVLTERRSVKRVNFPDFLEAITVFIGRLTGWVVLCMVLVQCLLVLMRYVFSLGSIGLQESIWYMHGLIFTLGAAYTLARDEHVRLDILYRGCSNVRKAWINLLGTVFGLAPLCAVTLWYGWGFVERSWRLGEGSAEVSGLPWIYAIKTAILLFAILLVLQGVVLATRSLVTIRASTAARLHD